MCPHGVDVGEPPRLERCPELRACECAERISHWLVTIAAMSKPDELRWWEAHGDL